MSAPTDTPTGGSDLHSLANTKTLTVEASAKVSAILTMVIILFVGGWVWASRFEPLPDFATMDISNKKQTFFSYLTPHIEAANQDIRPERARLLQILEQAEDLSWWQSRYLARLAATYDIDIPVARKAELLQALKLRVDTVPTALVLVQAAKESGWGTSRFARTGYSLFGQHCFEPGCGFMPNARQQGRKHEVARFTSVREAVDAYLHNLNTHHRYRQFRNIRANIRQAGEKLSGLKLADGLMAYSERGKAYINEVKQMIRTNELE